MAASISKFRIIYVENCSMFSSQKPLFTGEFTNLYDIKERIEYYIRPHPNMSIEYYTHRLGLRNRRILIDDELPQDVESIYVYLRSKTPLKCDICSVGVGKAIAPLTLKPQFNA
jgi:hypothetical protein